MRANQSFVIALFCVLLPLFTSNRSAVAQSRMQQIAVSAVQSIIVDYRSGTPQFSGLGRSGFECVAHAEDEDGNMIFWLSLPLPITSESRGIFLPDGSMIPGSDQILAHQSAVESIICPLPGESGVYYVLHTNFVDETFRIDQSHSYYSIVDMNMNGGSGGMRAINVLIGQDGDRPAEGMEVIALRNPCTDEYDRYLLMQYDMAIDAFTTRIFDADGFSEREILFNYAEPSGFSGRGELDFHEGKVGMAFNGSGRALVFNYEPTTQERSNQLEITIPRDGILDLFRAPGGLEFSPDGSKLYLTHFYFAANTIYQVELDNGLTQHKYDYDRLPGSIELGPDGKVYVAGQENIIVFDDPNLPAAPMRQLNLGGLLDGGFGMTDPVQYHTVPYGGEAPELIIQVQEEQCPCLGTARLTASDGFVSYRWNPGGETEKSIEVTESGSYFVTAFDEAGCSYDSEPVEIDLTTPRITLQMADLTADVGTTIAVPVEYEGPFPVAGCASPLADIVVSVDNDLIDFLGADDLTVVNTQVTGGRLEIRFTATLANDVLGSLNFAVCPTSDTRISALQFESATVDGCNFAFDFTNAQLTVRDAPLPIEGDLSLCTCRPQTTLTAPDGFMAYSWTPGNSNSRFLLVSEPGVYSVAVTTEAGCVLNSEPVTVEFLESAVEFSLSEAAGAAGETVQLTLDATVSGNDDPGCTPDEFELSLRYLQYPAAMLQAPAGLELVEVQRSGDYETVRLRGLRTDLPLDLDFLLLADAVHATDVELLDLEWVGCGASNTTFSDGRLEIDSTCITTRIVILAPGALMTVSGANPAAGETEVAFDTGTDGEVMLQLRSLSGGLAREFLREYRPAGSHRERLFTADIASGQYLLLLRRPEGSYESCLLNIVH